MLVNDPHSQPLLTLVQLQLLPWYLGGGQSMSSKGLLHRDPAEGLAAFESLQASAVLQGQQWQAQTELFKEMTGWEADDIGSARGPNPCRIHLADNDDNNDRSKKDQNTKEVPELSSSV